MIIIPALVSSSINWTIDIGSQEFCSSVPDRPIAPLWKQFVDILELIGGSSFRSRKKLFFCSKSVENSFGFPF